MGRAWAGCLEAKGRKKLKLNFTHCGETVLDEDLRTATEHLNPRDDDEGATCVPPPTGNLYLMLM